MITTQAPPTIVDEPVRTEVGCWDENGNYIECPGSGGVSSMANYVIPSGFGMSTCYGSFGTSLDADHDGVRDLCEFEIANAFRPLLSINENDAGRERESYWAVKYEAGYLKIFYALAYHDDPGYPGGALPSFAHKGDSEFLVVWVQNTYLNYWNLHQVFFSAHHGAPAESDELVSWQNIGSWADAERGRPISWVSQDKHANYKSGATCNDSHFNFLWLLPIYYDNCIGNFTGHLGQENEVEVLATGNLGNQLFRLNNCVAQRSHPSWFGVECLWDSFSGFFGWHWLHTPPGAGSYAPLLVTFGFGDPAPPPPPPPPPGGGDPLLGPGRGGA